MNASQNITYTHTHTCPSAHLLQQLAGESIRGDAFWKVQTEANSREQSRVLGVGLLLLVGLIFIEDNKLEPREIKQFIHSHTASFWQSADQY